MKFPQDFKKLPHRVSPNAVQYRPKDNNYPVFVSIVGGAVGLYGDGINTFEIMIGNKVSGHQSAEDINKILTELNALVND